MTLFGYIRTVRHLREGVAGKSKVSKVFTAGNRAARIRRSTMRWWRSMSSSSARRSRYWEWSTPSEAHWAAIFPYSLRKVGWSICLSPPTGIGSRIH